MACFNNHGKASLQGGFRQKDSCDCVLYHCLAAVSAPRCAGAENVTRSSVSYPDWPAFSAACTELSSVNRGKRPLSNIVVDFCSSFLLKDRVAVHPENLVDTTHAKTLTWQRKFCMRTQLDTFVHSSNDVCLCQELVRDELSRSFSDSECDSPSCYCGDLGHVLHVTNSPLRRYCTQVVHVVDDFRFLRVSFCSNFRIGVVEFLQVRRHQDRVTHNVTIVHVPPVRQASFFLQSTTWIVSSGEFSRITQLKIGDSLHSDCVFSL